MDVRTIGGEEDSTACDGEGRKEADAVIGISFTPSREYADAVNRQRRILNERAFGATAGDSWYMGFRDYDDVDPFARYREQEESKPITVPAWRERIEKAKRDIQKHKSEQRVQLLAEQLTDDALKKDIEVIRAWANSLKQINPRLQTGSRELTQAEMS